MGFKVSGFVEKSMGGGKQVLSLQLEYEIKYYPVSSCEMINALLASG